LQEVFSIFSKENGAQEREFLNFKCFKCNNQRLSFRVYIWYIVYFGESVCTWPTCGFVYRTRKAKWNIFGKLSIVSESLSMPLFLLGLSRC
jgi:hypothetical protein